MARLSPVLASLVVLGGCASVSPMTVVRMASFDPFTADPATIVARVSTPDGFELSGHGAHIAIEGQRNDTGETIDEIFELGPAGRLWQLSEAEAAAMRATQAKVRSWKEQASGNGHASLTIGVDGCVRSAEIDRKQEITADISIDGGQSFMPLLRNFTVEDALAEIEEAGESPWCSEG